MRNDFSDKDFESTEQEILSLLQQIQNEAKLPKDTEEGVQTDDLFADDEALEDTDPKLSFSDVPLIFDIDEPNESTERPSRRKVKKHALLATPAAQAAAAQQLIPTPVEQSTPKPKKTSSVAHSIFPYKGDSAGEVVRKCIFLISLVAFIGSIAFLTYFMVLEPQQVESDNLYYAELYNDQEGNEKSKDPYDYPAGMQSSFRQLYDINKDVAGWLSYVSSDKDMFLDIDLPVVLCDNNDKYLNHGFDGSKSRSGTLFFDSSNVMDPNVRNKVNIIYGHNMNSGAMFAGLNELVGNVYHARSAPYISLNTLYEKQEYVVFAVIVCDESAEQGRQFGYLRNSFADDTDFINYVNELRARSMFDYPVDVTAEDELLILSTCTNKHQVKLENGRLAVIARRVRDDEKTTIDTTGITKNEDVIMPYAWYTAQDKTPHVFYTQSDYHIPEDSIVQTTTTTTTGTTTSTTPSANTSANSSANTSGNTSSNTSRSTSVTRSNTVGNTTAPRSTVRSTSVSTIEENATTTTTTVSVSGTDASTTTTSDHATDGTADGATVSTSEQTNGSTDTETTGTSNQS